MAFKEEKRTRNMSEDRVVKKERTSNETNLLALQYGLISGLSSDKGSKTC